MTGAGLPDRYFTVIIPWSERPTMWHPTERTGPFSVLSRGAFKTIAAARAWADEHLAGEPYEVKTIDPSSEFASPALRTVGSAIQRGLMGLSGYFDGWGGYPPDWAVTTIELTGDRSYPYRVEGFNLNAAPGEYGHHFNWSVPDLCWRFRFELCPGAEGGPS